MAAKVIFGSFLLMSRSLVLKFIGLLSTLVLARVLMPEDFGLVAMAMLSNSFLQIFSRTGSAQYIMRADLVDDDVLNSAWTLNLMLKFIVAIALTASAPAISDYFNEDRLTPILLALAAMVVFGAFKNPGMLLYPRVQNYKPGVKLAVLSKVISAIVAVAIAVVFRSYWALIIGKITSTCITVIGSYILHTHRPRFTTSRIPEQLSFSLWLIPQALLGFARNQLDTLLVSSTFGAGQLGPYHTMKYLAFIPSAHFIAPATTPLLVELSKSRAKPRYFRTQHNVCFLVIMALALPMAFIMAGTAAPLVRVFLGSQWVDYADIFKWFAIMIPAYAMFQHATRTIMVFGRTRMTATYEVFAVFFIFTPLLIVGVDDVIRFAALRVLLDNASSFLFFAATTIIFTSISNLLRLMTLSLPLLGGCGLGVAAAALVPTTLHPLLFIPAYGALFAITFALVVVACALTVMRDQREWIYIHSKVLGGLAYLRARLVARLGPA